jgi:hypothetical protein
MTNTIPIFPGTPWANTADLSAVSACTTRGKIAHASLGSTPCFAVQLSPTSSAGRRIDAIKVRGSSTAISGATTAGEVIIWMSDGTYAWPIDELPVTAVTPSSTSAPFNSSKSYTDIVLPAGFSLWASSTVTTTASTNALAVQAVGGDY